MEVVDQDREVNRMKKLPLQVIFDFIRSSVQRIERENEELKKVINKKNSLFLVNIQEFDGTLKALDARMGDDPLKYSSTIKVDKDDFFIQMKTKVELLKNEKKRLSLEVDRITRENYDLTQNKQKVI